MCTQSSYWKSIHELEDLKYTNVNLRERLAKVTNELKELKIKIKMNESEWSESNESLLINHPKKRATAVCDFFLRYRWRITMHSY